MTTGDERKDAIGYAFTAPYILFLLVFTAYPLLFSFYLVFHSWDLITPPEYVGLKNFYFSGHWTSPGGGLPVAVKSARDVAQMICRNQNVSFRISPYLTLTPIV